MKKLVWIIFLLPASVIGQANLHAFVSSFKNFDLAQINEDFISSINNSETSRIDSADIETFLQHEIRPAINGYTVHDFLRFFKLGKSVLNKDLTILVYVKEGGAGGINRWIDGILIRDNKISCHLTLAELHADGGMRIVRTPEFLESGIRTTRNLFDLDFDTGEIESLESSQEEFLEYANCR